MNNDNYWYNIKDNNGSISIEKTLKEEKISEIDEEFFIETKKKTWKPVFFVLSLLIVIPFLTFFLFNLNKSNNAFKYRTFMIYMVGSDLESNGKVATYDLNDIKGNKIDLDNNNVLLMVGGSKKWHNFVNEDEIGLYELTNTGFKKVKTYSLSSMGSSKTLKDFIDYTTDNYESEKYDMIFWNHGLGSVGVEDDEVFEDYLDIQEMDNVFSKTKFATDKLELVIFNNCMSGNIHIASVMKKYANYMVASEEVMYVGSIINRLDFLNDIKKSDNGYDVGLTYVKKSDESINKANVDRHMSLDSTLSIIDLSKIDEVINNVDKFFESINLEEDYKAVSRARRRTKTYGDGEYAFDTIDLYTFVDKLKNVSDENLKNNLQESIEDAIIYNSALNEYSNGLSIYFPYYGSEEHIETHLYYFDKLWNNKYLDFIHKYVDLSLGAKRANRSGNEDAILYLTNKINYEDNKVVIELTEEEKEMYQDANIYIFDNNYNLLLKTDDISLKDNKLITDDLVFLKTSNDKIISAVKEKELYKVYGLVDNSDVVIKLENNKGYGNIKSVLVDSKDKPVGGIIEYDKENISYYSLKYNNLNREFNNEWNSNIDKESLNNSTNSINFVFNDLKDCYVLIAVFDINNDVFYSRLTQIK